MKPTKSCKNCGDTIFETGNYTYKLRKSKRIPRKSLKAIKSGDTSSLQESHSKFGNFLIQRCHPKNTVEITCGNCEFVLKMSLSKPLDFLNKQSHNLSESFVAEEPKSKRRRKSKKPKEVNAGLIISPVVPSGGSTTRTLVSPSTLPSPPTTTSTPIKVGRPKISSHQSNQNKKKSLDSLRKGLLKSQTQTQGASLKDFLSSM